MCLIMFDLSLRLPNCGMQIACADPNQAQVDKLKDTGIYLSTDNAEVVRRSSVIMLAVKPSIIPNVLSSITSIIKDHLIVSVAAGWHFAR